MASMGEMLKKTETQRWLASLKWVIIASSWAQSGVTNLNSLHLRKEADRWVKVVLLLEQSWSTQIIFKNKLFAASHKTIMTETLAAVRYLNVITGCLPSLLPYWLVPTARRTFVANRLNLVPERGGMLHSLIVSLEGSQTCICPSSLFLEYIV